ncbi:hypothetical protein JQ625_27640 [Bradyrhizobium diazoefficiens]|nr:hypothetical protein [Bradyrhizobium diazoefficiens]MBR0778620.1 hypothetical protein [Bradyrhizobium diazoefficiens]
MSRAVALARIMALVVVNLVTAALSIEPYATAVEALGLGSCVSDYVTLSCDLVREPAFQWSSHLVLLGAALAVLAVTSIGLIRLSIAPFLFLMIAALLFCLSFDMAFQLHVKNFSRLFSSTFNLTTLVMFFSFLFMMVIMRFEIRLGWRFIGAMLQSYFTRDVAFLFYAAVQGAYIGTTALYLLFIAFAFGAFTIHIMSIAGICRHSARLRNMGAA